MCERSPFTGGNSHANGKLNGAVLVPPESQVTHVPAHCDSISLPLSRRECHSRKIKVLFLDHQQPELKDPNPNPSPSLQQAGACGIAVKEHLGQTLTDLSFQFHTLTLKLALIKDLATLNYSFQQTWTSVCSFRKNTAKYFQRLISIPSGLIPLRGQHGKGTATTSS